jgi:HD-GYP domain-containing protein (c-di-GMP phosphodiesterase class II)
MPSYTKVEEGDITLGVPLDNPIYDKNGTLLVKAGVSIETEHHLQILLEKEIYFGGVDDTSTITTKESEARKEVTNVFDSLDTLKIRLKRLFDLIRAGKAQEEFLERIEDAAITVQQVCALDSDAALANMHIEHDFPYAVLHHLQAAILCEIAGKKLGVKDEARQKLVKAALTHDIDLLDIQHVLDQQTIPLSELFKERIQSHPKNTAAKLKGLGVSDKTWLDAVEQHHERLDGSGYGKHLSGSAISIPARLLAIADIYSAMIRDRAHRRAILTKDALRKLIQEHGGKLDGRLTQVLIKEIGVFPPGILVQLESKEIAVVKNRPENGINPIVYAFINELGKPMSAPSQRDTSAPEYKITSIVPITKYLSSFPIIRSLWSNG